MASHGSVTDWIKTSDEMPAPDRWVLGWFDRASRATITCRRDGGFQIDGEDDSSDPPTHWQPLPSRPYRVITCELTALKRLAAEEEGILMPPDAPTRVYSGEHHAWWRRVGDSKGGNGYAIDVGDAGVWTFAEAYAATCHCGAEKQIVLEALLPA